MVKKETTKISVKSTPEEDKKAGLLARLVTYLKGAWAELKEVRWPNRKSTWELTLAVLGFSTFFVILILLLDALFKYLFTLMIN